jgi:hypothetical protein
LRGMVMWVMALGLPCLPCKLIIKSMVCVSSTGHLVGTKWQGRVKQMKSFMAVHSDSFSFLLFQDPNTRLGPPSGPDNTESIPSLADPEVMLEVRVSHRL